MLLFLIRGILRKTTSNNQSIQAGYIGANLYISLCQAQKFPMVLGSQTKIYFQPDPFQ